MLYLHLAVKGLPQMRSAALVDCSHRDRCIILLQLRLLV